MMFSLEVALLIIGGIWLTILTFFLWQISTHYNRLTRNVNDKTLKSVLETLLKEAESAKKDIAYLRDRCDKIEQEGLLHIQKIGLLRFNPFKDTGGNQSFIVCFVDGKDNGVVISGLYSRSGTRWYAKEVALGKGVEHQLSDEEKKALKGARSIQK